jgi:hypothetical protein
MAIEVNPLQDTNTTNIPLVESLSNIAFFDPSIDHVEYVIQSNDKSFISTNYDFKNYRFPTNGTIINNMISDIDIDPISDLTNNGLNNGIFIVSYNFLRNQLQTSYQNQNLFIKEISADRTELKLDFLQNNIFTSELENFKILITNNFNNYFEEFYLNFGDNNLIAANNFDYNSTTYEIIVNLVNPLPNILTVNTPLWIVTKIADSLVFRITSTPEPISPTVTSFPLRGPNFNLSLNDQINNSTDYNNYSTLITSSLLSTSYSQLNNLISSSGIEINVDYTDFNNFIYFSSAVQRINNFTYKVSQISSSQAEINILNGSIGYITSSNIITLTNQINNIIENFDGYEYFLYYGTGSWSWPKSTSTIPYTLFSPTSTEVINWLGSSNINSTSGVLGSASLFDNSNSNQLIKSIPDYLKDDPQNTPYNLFIDMMGQHYDDIWLYYKDVTNLYQADNRLDYGISKDLIKQALESFGVYIYQNNFSSNDLYTSFLGYGTLNPETTNVLPVTTGSFQDYINNYITASYDASVTPLDDYNKEIYKRIYHNLPYLAKTKGTIPGLRALINCFGVPDTVLRISEFGGRDKDTSTYDYFDQQFNYALNIEQDADTYVTSSFRVQNAWPNNHSINGGPPDAIQLRIKPYVASDFSQPYSQSIFEVSGSTGGYTSNLTLTYTGSGLISSSYSGSTYSSSYQFATLTLDVKGNSTSTCSIYAPFFDGNWWSIMISRSGSLTDGTTDNSTFTLYAGNRLYYDGYDGNQIGYLVSSSYAGPTWGWNGDDIYHFSTPIQPHYSTYSGFVGLAQEIRYLASTQSVEPFKDYIMNPQSIDNLGETTYADRLIFRAPLGGDLYTGSISVHPKITGSWAITQSFKPVGGGTLSGFKINRPNFTPNVETRFLNSPIIGLRGRVTDKIQIVSSSLPTGSVLSQYTSLEQNYPSLGSESPDVNLLEVAFSPQNEINDDIIDSLGYFNIGEYIGDPRQVSSSATSYPDLVNLSNNFFQKYFDTYNLKDYVRLIKYFDNSLFKMIKDFVPARTSLTSGVVIKQHILERNKYPQPQVEWEELDYSGSIDTAFFSGSTGGTFNNYNTLIAGVGSVPGTGDAPLVYSGSFIVNSASPINYFTVSSSGLYFDNRNNPDQIEFVNGEIVTYFTGKTIIGTTGIVPASETVTFILSSSIQGQITSSIIATGGGPVSFQIYSPYISCSNEERFSLWIQGDAGTIPTTLSPIYFGVYEFLPYSEQTWTQYYTGSTGVSTIIYSSQDEFYNGELPGTEFTVVDGELNPDNEFKLPTTLEIYYDPTLYLSNITPLGDFLDINTSPNQGEIYLWYDTGSILQPGGPPIQR